jgi:hypothetical protein
MDIQIKNQGRGPKIKTHKPANTKKGPKANWPLSAN